MGTDHETLLFDGELPSTTVLSLGFVHTSIGTTTDEAYDLVALIDTLLVVIAGEHGLGGIRRVCR
jgi:hypothetical protein